MVQWHAHLRMESLPVFITRGKYIYLQLAQWQRWQEWQRNWKVVDDDNRQRFMNTLSYLPFLPGMMNRAAWYITALTLVEIWLPWTWSALVSKDPVVHRLAHSFVILAHSWIEIRLDSNKRRRCQRGAKSFQFKKQIMETSRKFIHLP